VRSFASFRVDWSCIPIFFEIVPLINPRIVWFCQLVALAISAVVSPCFRRGISSTIAFFVSPRSLVADLAAFCDFLPAFPWADFFDPDFDCLVVEASFDALFEDFRFVGADSLVVAWTSVLITFFSFVAVDPLLHIHHSSSRQKKIEESPEIGKSALDRRSFALAKLLKRTCVFSSEPLSGTPAYW
jgi:hypothetical protein